ncbi:MAG: hypothetical protein ABEJ73_12345 [Haloplanus sp.]
MSLVKCGLCGTYHDDVADAMQCCSDRFNDDGDAGAAPVAMADGGVSSDVDPAEAERRARTSAMSFLAWCGRANVDAREVLDDVREEVDEGGDGEPRRRPGSELGRQADALEALVDQQRIQNAALVELTRTLDNRAAEEIGLEEPTSGRNGRSIAGWVEDAALDIEERVDLDAVDLHAEGSR